MEYLRVKNWERFQHYKTGKNAEVPPQWIKLYRAILRDYEFSRLTVGEKGQLLCIWLLASEMDNKLPADPTWVQRMIDSEEDVDLDKFLSLGFLETYGPSYNNPRKILGQRREEVEVEKEREKNAFDLTPVRIGPDAEESQEQVAEDEGEDLRPPTQAALSALATLFQDYPERHAVRDHNTSAVYGSQAYAVTIQFLAPLFPDPRPGAGLSHEVTEWTGKIPIRDCAIAVREITRRLYPAVNGGRERTWNELDEGIQKRIVTHEFNAMLQGDG